eukprot:1078648-Pleurochrysis_carterae.AAC.1
MTLRKQGVIGHADRDVQFHVSYSQPPIPPWPPAFLLKRSTHFGKPNSFLHHRRGVPHHFKCRARHDIDKVVLAAAKKKSDTARKELLDNNGLNVSNFKFDGEAGMEHSFAPSETYVPNMD